MNLAIENIIFGMAAGFVSREALTRYPVVLTRRAVLVRELARLARLEKRIEDLRLRLYLRLGPECFIREAKAILEGKRSQFL